MYVAKEGVNTVDIFRRPGNPSDIRRVVKRLSEGKPVIFSNYSFYTLASVIKVMAKCVYIIFKIIHCKASI